MYSRALGLFCTDDVKNERADEWAVAMTGSEPLSRSVAWLRSSGAGAGECVLGVVFVWAGVVKWVSPNDARALAEAILPFVERVPAGAMRLTAVGEWILGIILILGVGRTQAKLLCGILLVVYCAAIMIAVLSGYQGTCGCLGLNESLSVALARNGILLGVLCLCMAQRRSRAGFHKKGGFG